MEYDSFMTFALLKMPGLSPAVGKSDIICIIDRIIVIPALICTSYTRKLVILKTLRIVKCFVLQMVRKIKNELRTIEAEKMLKKLRTLSLRSKVTGSY